MFSNTVNGLAATCCMEIEKPSDSVSNASINHHKFVKEQ